MDYRIQGEIAGLLGSEWFSWEFLGSRPVDLGSTQYQQASKQAARFGSWDRIGGLQMIDDAVNG